MQVWHKIQSLHWTIQACNNEGSRVSLSAGPDNPFEGKSEHCWWFCGDEIGVTTSTSAFTAYSYKIFFDTSNETDRDGEAAQHSLCIAWCNNIQDNLLELGVWTIRGTRRGIDATIPTVEVGICEPR
jgi:hypothetical protein